MSFFSLKTEFNRTIYCNNQYNVSTNQRKTYITLSTHVHINCSLKYYKSENKLTCMLLYIRLMNSMCDLCNLSWDKNWFMNPLTLIVPDASCSRFINLLTLIVPDASCSRFINLLTLIVPDASRSRFINPLTLNVPDSSCSRHESC
jgi:hypothetical protein